VDAAINSLELAMSASPDDPRLDMPGRLFVWREGALHATSWDAPPHIQTVRQLLREMPNVGPNTRVWLIVDFKKIEGAELEALRRLAKD
jgi:hypothetical protein